MLSVLAASGGTGAPLSGALSLENCIPDMKNGGNGGGVVSYLQELLKLSPAQVIGVGIHIKKRLSTTTLSGSSEYKIPSDRDLVVFRIRPAWQPTDIADEVVVNSIFSGGFTYNDLERLRMGNCRVQLLNKDRQLKVFDNEDMLLSAMKDVPLAFDERAPLLVPATHTLQATFSLSDSTPAVVGLAADYGVILEGVLIPKRV
jgi:hypothetical protein